MKKLFSLLVLCLFLAASAQAQRLPFPLDMPTPAASYMESIPTHEDVFGHVVGTRHTVPHQVVEYFQAVDAASDRVIVRQHGRTYENRPLIHAIVTSPANHARLDQILAQNRRLFENPQQVTDAELANMPVVLYQGYSIHGNEASGTEAALLYLYHLAAATGPQIEQALENAVIIVDPLFNPDGRDRFTDWANRNRGGVAVADPQDREHNEPWPGGRTNHYWFDLNRDWLPVQHVESQARIELFYQYRPQVLTDHHEMGSESTFFFQPGIPSRTNPNTPALNQQLTAEIGEYHARVLDQIGSLYYSEESFDDFYYGKGSTYPDINGAIGILFEQASSRALEREVSNGVLTYAFTVRNQFATSLSTLEAGLAMRQRLLQQMRDFYRSAPAFARQQPVKAYLIGLGEHRTRGQALAQMLQHHRINVHQLSRDLSVDGQTFRAGEAYIIPVEQAQARLLKAVMERVTEFQDSLFYDVSTWTMPLAYDVHYGEMTREPAAYLGAVVPPITFDGGQLIGTSNYGYLLRWNRYFAPRALYKLMAAGIAPRLLTEPFDVVENGQRYTFPRGTVLIPVAQQGVSAEDVQRLVRQVVEEDAVEMVAVTTGLTPTGPELGGNSTSALEMPRIALITGSGTDSNNAGEAWHLLSERFRIPVSLLDTDQLGRADLSRYNTIILAGGFYGGMPADPIRDWVRNGGRLIALESGVSWAVRNGLVELESSSPDFGDRFRDLSYAEVQSAMGAHQIGGSIFSVRLDPTHPVAYGFDEEVAVFHSGTTFYQPSTRPGTNVGVYADEARISGYISPAMAEVAGGSAAIVAQRVGRGNAVLFSFNPNFRAFWWGTQPLFMNAIFFGGSF